MASPVYSVDDSNSKSTKSAGGESKLSELSAAVSEAAIDLGHLPELTAKLQNKVHQVSECLVVQFLNHAIEKGLSGNEIQAEDRHNDLLLHYFSDWCLLVNSADEARKPSFEIEKRMFQTEHPMREYCQVIVHSPSPDLLRQYSNNEHIILVNLNIQRMKLEVGTNVQ